jgi:hypothetical protein
VGSRTASGTPPTSPTAAAKTRRAWTPLAFCRSWAWAQQLAATIAHFADLGTLGTAEHTYWKTLGQKPGAVHSNSTASSTSAKVESLSQP